MKLRFLLCLSLAVASAQDTVIRSTVHEVLLDVVVRHKNLSLEEGLTTKDFTVTEDGVTQTITSFRWIGGKQAIEGQSKPVAVLSPQQPNNPAAADLNGTRNLNFVSVVFGNVDPANRRTALSAALDFLKQQFRVNTYAAIFSLRSRLDVATAFTNDKDRLGDAVKLAVNGAPAALVDRTTDVLNQTLYNVSGGPGGITAGPLVNPASTPDLAVTSAAGNPLSESMSGLAAMLATQEHLIQNYAGMQELTGLLHIVRYQSDLPGRKTVLYISDGLTKAPARDDMMTSLIGMANRGNVAFYCIDSRGLMLQTSNGASAGLTTSAARASQAQMSGTHGDGDMSKFDSIEIAQTALASNPQLAMEELAEETGGFAVFNTNEFKKPMQRMMEDVQSHYELTYVPTSSVYDGRFRKIKVSVDEPKLVVQARSGYFAVPELDGKPVSVSELAALHVLDEPQRPQDFPFRVAAMRFHPELSGFEYAITFEVPTEGLTTALTEGKTTARVHVDCLALVKNSSGQIVAKVSNEIDREIPADKLDQFRRGNVVLSSTTQLPPGRYVVEAAVVDPERKRGSTKRISLVVARPGSPAISSVVLARSIEPTHEVRDPADPFALAGGKLTPNLQQKIPAGTDTVLYFVVYPKPGSESNTPKARVIVDLLKDGKAVQRLEPPLGKLDAINSVPVILDAKLSPGNYIARATAVQGEAASQESIVFQVGDN